MNNLSSALDAQVSHYWSAYLGCTPLDLADEQTLIIPSAAHTGLVALSKGKGWVVAVPAHWGQTVLGTLPQFFASGQLPHLPSLRHVLTTNGAPDLYGPARIFLQPTPLPLDSPPISLRPLQAVDLPHVHTFEAEIGALAWSFGQGDGWLCAWGGFVEERLVAVCAVRVWGDLLAEIYIDTLPTCRNRGYGKAVTSATVQWVQAHTPYVVESVVEVDNAGSLALMASLHFVPYGYLLLSDTMTTCGSIVSE